MRDEDGDEDEVPGRLDSEVLYRPFFHNRHEVRRTKKPLPEGTGNGLEKENPWVIGYS